MVARRLFACVLLLLLVFQPAAAVTFCAHAMQAQAGAAQAEMPCHQSGMDGMQAAQPDSDGTQGQAPGDASHGGCTSVACGLCSALAQTLPPVAVVSQHERLAVSPASRFISFVPEGLQRPPSIRA